VLQGYLLKGQARASGRRQSGCWRHREMKLMPAVAIPSMGERRGGRKGTLTGLMYGLAPAAQPFTRVQIHT
jgi:hypothetical protein